MSKTPKTKSKKSYSIVSKVEPRPPPKTLSLWPPETIGYHTNLFYRSNDDNPLVRNERKDVFKIMKRIQEKNPDFFYNELNNNKSILIDEVKDHILDSIEEPERKENRSLAREHILRQHTQKLQEHAVSKHNSLFPERIHNYFNPEPKTPALPQDTPRKPGVPESPRFYKGVPTVSKGGKTRRKVQHKKRRKTQHNNK